MVQGKSYGATYTGPFETLREWDSMAKGEEGSLKRKI